MSKSGKRVKKRTQKDLCGSKAAFVKMLASRNVVFKSNVASPKWIPKRQRKWKMKFRKKCQREVRKDIEKKKKDVSGRLFLGTGRGKNAGF